MRIAFIPYIECCCCTWIRYTNTQLIHLLSISGSDLFSPSLPWKVSGLHTDELFNLLALHPGYFPSSLSLKHFLRDSNDEYLKGLALAFGSKIFSFSLKLTCHQAVRSAQVSARIFIHNLSTWGLPSEWRDRTPLILTDTVWKLFSVCVGGCGIVLHQHGLYGIMSKYHEHSRGWNTTRNQHTVKCLLIHLLSHWLWPTNLQLSSLAL